MNKAYDAVFQIEVDAEEIAKTSYQTIGNRYRYQCLCCGEEVYLAAADSTIKAPHFRHRRGNNDIDCESYLGQPGAVEHYISIRKRNKEHIGFCFNIEQMTFECSVKFDSDEIEKYAKDAQKISLYSKYYSQPFLSIPINRGNLIPDNASHFTLNDYANDYYVSIDLGATKIKYPDVIRRNGKINIYRTNQTDCHYKRNKSDVLYTKCNYIAISEDKECIDEIQEMQEIEIDGIAISFITLGKRFYAIVFKVLYADYSARLFFQKHDFKLETSESFSVLWPPVFKDESLLVSDSKKVYVSSSFGIVPHGNADSSNIAISCLDKNVSEITFNEKVTISEKNVECIIIHKNSASQAEICEEIQVIYTDKYIIPEMYDYYMFDKNGCNRLAVGSKVYLSGADRIVGYKNGHIKVYVFAEKEKEITKKTLIGDIVKYHPQSELFEPDEFMDIEADETVLSYIESCYRSGQINTVIKQLIKGGMI